MTVLSQGRAPPQPHSKAPSTVQSSRLEAIADNGTTKPPTSAQPKPRAPKARQDQVSTDFTSTSATLLLIRRVLAPEKSANIDTRASSQPVEDTLPPLTSSNDIDVQLYAIIAIVIKDFVNTWYSKITPDHDFIDEIIQIIAHCSRALEQRLRRIDVVELLLDGIPALLGRHVSAYRTAVETLTHNVYGLYTQAVYHALSPHPALEPLNKAGDQQAASEQEQNEAVYRQLLVGSALAVLLPTEDVQNGPLRILVGDIIADLIVGQAIAGKLCEGWFIHETIAKIAAVVKDRIEPEILGEGTDTKAKSRLEEFGLLGSDQRSDPLHQSSTEQSSFSVWIWRIMQGIFSMFLIMRFIFKGVAQARNGPGRSKFASVTSGSPRSTKHAHVDKSDHPAILRPVLSYNSCATVATIFRFDDRMPWMTSVSKFWQHVLLFGTGRLAAADSVLDRFLYSTIQTHVLSPSIIPSVLLNLRIALFPNNSLGPPAPSPPSPEERLIIRRKAAQSILSLLPPVVARMYFHTNNEEDIVRQIEEDLLAPFDDVYMNKHLVYGILEMVMCRLLPELTEGTVGDLLSERGVTVDHEDEKEK